MKKTILNKLINDMPKNNFVGSSSVWDYYGSGTFANLINNEKSNLRGFLLNRDSISESDILEGITIFTGAKGRSAHSKTDLHIFKGDHSEKGGIYFTFSALQDFGIK